MSKQMPTLDAAILMIKLECPGGVRFSKSHCNALLKEITQLREWRETAEDLLGQRGVENISAMIEIIEAAMAWDPVTNRGLARLKTAVESYEAMVASRTKEES